MLLLSILAFLVIFSFLILIHEAGHYYAAVRAGVKVEEFGLGLGPKIYGFRRGETEFTLNLIPFGGFVRMLGEEESSDNPRSFEKASLCHRIQITLAGIFMNYVFAILALTILFVIGTKPILVSKQDVLRAESQGLVTLSKPNEAGLRTIEYQKEIQLPLHHAVLTAIHETGRISWAVVEKVGEIPGEIIRKQSLPEELSGPVGIAQITHQVRPEGFWALFRLAALLSISLAVMNLLPIPALDGGRFVFQLFELVTRRKPNPRWEMTLHYGGFILLLGLLLAITFRDITRLF